MVLSPIAFIAPNYRDYKNWWLKAYEPGTTTPKIMALDSTGAVTVAKLELNKDGFIKSAGGALVIPYLNDRYDLFLFPTEAEADANDTVNAEQVADNILGVLPDAAIEDLLINDLSQAYDFQTVAEMRASTALLPDSKTVNVLSPKSTYKKLSGVGTANNIDILASNTLSASYQLIVDNTLNVLQLGALDGSDLELILERASQISDIILINSEGGINFTVINPPTLPNSFTSIMMRNNLDGAAPESINGKIMNAGISAGVLTAPDFGDKNLFIVAGTVRKKEAAGGVDGDKWLYINDVGHRTIGVNGAPMNPPATFSELTAIGNVLTIPLPKTYELVGSVIVGPDERLARTLNASFGASVDNNQFSITGGCLYKASYLIYWDGAAWQQEQKSSFGLGTLSFSYTAGNLVITHESFPGLDALAVPSSNGGTTAPFMPCLKTVGTGSTVINFIDTSSSTLELFNGAENTAMSFIWTTEYKGQIILDGSSGSHVIDDQLVQGNIWFYGVFTDTLST